MEPILLLLLLTSMQQGGDLNAALGKFLSFYRENRELILLLARGGAPAAAQTEQSAGQTAGQTAQQTPEQKTDRPQEDSPIVSILEEYLNRGAAR